MAQEEMHSGKTVIFIASQINRSFQSQESQKPPKDSLTGGRPCGSVLGLMVRKGVEVPGSNSGLCSALSSPQASSEDDRQLRAHGEQVGGQGLAEGPNSVKREQCGAWRTGYGVSGRKCLPKRGWDSPGAPAPGREQREVKSSEHRG
jgi:hypothetical protein